MWADVRGGGVCQNFKTIYDRFQWQIQSGECSGGWTPPPFRKKTLLKREVKITHFEGFQPSPLENL